MTDSIQIREARLQCNKKRCNVRWNEESLSWEKIIQIADEFRGFGRSYSALRVL